MGHTVIVTSQCEMNCKLTAERKQATEHMEDLLIEKYISEGKSGE